MGLIMAFLAFYRGGTPPLCAGKLLEAAFRRASGLKIDNECQAVLTFAAGEGNRRQSDAEVTLFYAKAVLSDASSRMARLSHVDLAAAHGCERGFMGGGVHPGAQSGVYGQGDLG